MNRRRLVLKMIARPTEPHPLPLEYKYFVTANFSAIFIGKSVQQSVLQIYFEIQQFEIGRIKIDLN